jgi:pimeloyl-ACP methyl ester carboxylesterase
MATTNNRSSRRIVVKLKKIAAVLAATAAVALSASATTAASADTATDRTAKPTIVLVHGAFADGSSWNGVVERLQRDGYDVVAPAVPLRGLASDAAYIAGVVRSVGGSCWSGTRTAEC